MTAGSPGAAGDDGEALHEVEVEWGDLDSAKIAFYPRLFAWADAAAHRLFRRANVRLDQMLLERKVSFGLVSVSADFHSPARYADRLVVRSSIVRFGNRSLELRHRIAQAAGGEPVATIRETRACFDLREADRLRSAEIPADVREALSRFLAPAA